MGPGRRERKRRTGPGGHRARNLLDGRAIEQPAFIEAWMHSMAHVRKEHANVIPGFEEGWDGAPQYQFHTDFQNATDQLDHQLGQSRAVQSIVNLSISDILAQERPKLQKQLSRAVSAHRHTCSGTTLLTSQVEPQQSSPGPRQRGSDAWPQNDYSRHHQPEDRQSQIRSSASQSN